MRPGTSAATTAWPSASRPRRCPSAWRSSARRCSSVELSCDRPNALLCARLCDVAPDGASLRVTYGLLNLTHRDSHERSRAARARPALCRPPAAQRHRARVSGRATASAWRCRRPTGRSPGRRPRRQPSRCRPRGSGLALPVRHAATRGRRGCGRSRRPRARRRSAARRCARAASSAASAYDVATDTMTYTSIARFRPAAHRRDRPGARGDRAQDLPDQERRSALGRQRDRTGRRGAGAATGRCGSRRRTRMRATPRALPDRCRARRLRGRAAGVLAQLARRDPARPGVSRRRDAMLLYTVKRIGLAAAHRAGRDEPCCSA